MTFWEYVGWEAAAILTFGLIVTGIGFALSVTKIPLAIRGLLMLLLAAGGGMAAAMFTGMGVR